jgi:phosphoribosylaminoimidazolecarboxamide formyltransferase/IMP cyclohydrolase
MSQPIRSALISVYYKDRLEPLVALLKEHGVKLYSTGGTQQFLEEQGAEVTAVESLTGFPAVFGGRVKTLHPKVFGGILHRRHAAADLAEAEQHAIPPIDLVIVDLYPFEETVAAGASEEDTIEKIDIGGISLLRAAAKNYRDVLVVSSRDQYAAVTELLRAKNGATDLEDRRHYAAAAFEATSHYDTHIFHYLSQGTAVDGTTLKVSQKPATALRYGENPHQAGTFYGDLPALFDQLHGKQLSYNNLVDVDAAVLLMQEFLRHSQAHQRLRHCPGRHAG